VLKTRVITALVLLALLLPSLFFLPPDYWALLLTGFVGVAAWEWGALLRWGETARRMLGIGFAAVCGCVIFLAPEVIGAAEVFQPAPVWVRLVYGLATIFWCGLMPLWLRSKWALGGGVVGLLIGLLLLFSTWLAMVQLRMLGPAVLLAFLAVAWVADIAAYFAGRKFGKHKLAPSISPGKTWEGAVGAVLGVIIYGLALRASFAFEAVALPWWVLLLMAITAVSIIGDLYESMLKRQAGIKDSSHVLPGHGGVLDRIDSLTSTLPVIAFLWLLLAAPKP
jgi:phosphatidate cytidylyltransferase